MDYEICVFRASGYVEWCFPSQAHSTRHLHNGDYSIISVVVPPEWEQDGRAYDYIDNVVSSFDS